MIDQCSDAFGEQSNNAEEWFVVIPPNATITMSSELVSFKVVKEVTKDKKIIKKILKEADGYEKPSDGTIIQIMCIFYQL